MKDRIISCMRMRGGRGISFAELKLIDGFSGQKCIHPEGFDNVVIWNGVSQEFVDAFAALTASGDIEVKSCSVIVYFCDGESLPLPVAKSIRKYKTPHWLPVTFSLSSELLKAPRTWSKE